jgi:hypothetical protein
VLNILVHDNVSTAEFGRILFTFGVQDFYCSRSVNLNIPAPKIEALQVDPKIRIGDFLENGSNNFYYISVIYWDYIPK